MSRHALRTGGLRTGALRSAALLAAALVLTSCGSDSTDDTAAEGTDPTAYLAAYTCDKIPSPETQWAGQNINRVCDPAYEEMLADLPGGVVVEVDVKRQGRSLNGDRLKAPLPEAAVGFGKLRGVRRKWR